VCKEGAKLSNSKSCECEEGFTDEGETCTRRKVTYSLSVNEDNEIFLTFSEPVDFSAKDLAVFVEGLEAVQFIVERSSLTAYQLILILSPDLNIGEGASMSVQVLLNGEGVEPTSEQSSSFALPRMVTPATSEDQTAKAVGSSARLITTVAISALAFSGLASGNMTAVWTLINSLQILSYIPMMDLSLPKPLFKFFTNLLSFGILPNIFQYFVPNEGPTVPKSAERIGTDTSLFLLNSGDLLTTFALSLVAIPLIYLGSRLNYSLVRKHCVGLLKDFRWNFFIRLAVEGYLELTFSCLLQVFVLPTGSPTTSISYALSIVAALLCLVLPIALTAFTYNNHQHFSTDPALKERYGSLFDEFKSDRGFLSNCYYPYFIIRRLAYITELWFLVDYPAAQAVLNIGLAVPVSCTQVFLFVLVYKPFKGSLINYNNLYSEGVVSLTFVLTSLYLIDVSSSARTALQWTIVGLVYSMILADFCLACWLSFLNYRDILRSWRLKSQLKMEREQVTGKDEGCEATEVISGSSQVIL
jgi:hypothetical protein